MGSKLDPHAEYHAATNAALYKNEDGHLFLLGESSDITPELEEAFHGMAADYAPHLTYLGYFNRINPYIISPMAPKGHSTTLEDSNIDQ
jgi:hypothetical protein